MLEGIVDSFFRLFLININNFLQQENTLVFFISFALVLTKQFISIIVLMISIFSSLRLNKKILLSFIPLVLDLLNKYLNVNFSLSLIQTE